MSISNLIERIGLCGHQAIGAGVHVAAPYCRYKPLKIGRPSLDLLHRERGVPSVEYLFSISGTATFLAPGGRESNITHWRLPGPPAEFAMLYTATSFLPLVDMTFAEP